MSAITAITACTCATCNDVGLLNRHSVSYEGVQYCCLHLDYPDIRAWGEELSGEEASPYSVECLRDEANAQVLIAQAARSI